MNTYETNQKPSCVLPHKDVQNFLLGLISQSSFKGDATEFVSAVKVCLANAAIAADTATEPILPRSE